MAQEQDKTPVVAVSDRARDIIGADMLERLALILRDDFNGEVTHGGDHVDVALANLGRVRFHAILLP